MKRLWFKAKQNTLSSVARPQQKLWFRAKNYGWGWTPATWQGWLILTVYLVLFTFVFVRFEKDIFNNSNPDSIFWFLGKIVVLTSILIFICYRTGEKPRWRWGRKDS